MKYQVIFTSWNEDLKKVSFVSLLRKKGGMSFFAAKRVLEAILLGEEVGIELATAEEAKELKKETTKLGTKSKVTRINTGRKIVSHHANA